jgi:hypothetical protein
LREIERREAEVFVPLVHRPGDEAQVDFFEVTVDVAGLRRKAWKFLVRLMRWLVVVREEIRERPDAKSHRLIDVPGYTFHAIVTTLELSAVNAWRSTTVEPTARSG